MFRDRISAGLLLAEKLRKYKNDPGIVLAVPRGGVPVAYAIARKLGFPLEIILTKKIGHPFNKEYAIGAASLTDHFIVPGEDIPAGYIDEELRRIRNRLKEMQGRFMGDQEPANLKGKTVIIVDDGVATGNTMLATIQVLRKSQPGKMVIAVPVASKSAVRKLATEVDDVIALLVPENFYGVGAFYEDFTQVDDEEAMMYLSKLKQLKNAG